MLSSLAMVSLTCFLCCLVQGEVTWGGALSTNFYVSPKDETALVYMVQIKPYAEEVKHVS